MGCERIFREQTSSIGQRHLRIERGRSDEELLEDLAVSGHWFSPSELIEINDRRHPLAQEIRSLS